MNLKSAIMFELDTTWDRPAKINSQLSEHILRVRIDPANIPPQTLPLQLAVAIDTSASMQGEKWQQAKIATQQLIGQLRPSDRLSLAGFADWVTPVATNIENSQLDNLQSVLDTLVAEGVTRTDLALDWIRSSLSVASGEKKLPTALPTSTDPSRIGILITDGHPTSDRGVQLEDVSPLITRAGRMAAEEIMLCTVGLGNADNFNTALLVDLSDRGRGTFIYADTPTLLGSQLRQRLHSAQKVAVENAILKLNMVSGVTLKSCCQFRPDYLPLQETAPGEILLSKLRIDTPTDVLLALEVSALSSNQLSGTYIVGEVQLQTEEFAPVAVRVGLQFTPSYREAQQIDRSVDSDRLIWDINRFTTELAGVDDALQTGELLGQIQAAAIKSGQTAIANEAEKQLDDLEKTGKLNAHQTTGLLRASRQLGGL